MITLVDGKPRVLRGTAWFNLSEGVRVRDGDTLDVPDKAQLQLEMTDGGAVSLIGPGALYAASFAPRDGKQSASAELFLTRGWLKLDTKPPGARFRLRTPLGTISASDGAAVVHVAADAIEMFVETGAVKLAEASKPDAAGTETKGGGFIARTGKVLETASRAPPAFVGAMPRDFMDPLPRRAAKFASARADPAPDRDATFAEAQPWLTGPYRSAFMKRFEPKLTDPAFRTAAEASGRVLPEWTTAAKPKAEPAPSPPPVKEREEKPKEPERTWHWPWEKPKN